MLTEDQVRAIYAESMKHRDPVPYIHRAIEAAVLAELAKQEPVAHVVDRENCRVWWNDRYTHISQAPKNNTPLYAAPVVQPDDIRDAERYRKLRAECGFNQSNFSIAVRHPYSWEIARTGEEFDAAIDAAIAAEKEQK